MRHIFLSSETNKCDLKSQERVLLLLLTSSVVNMEHLSVVYAYAYVF